MCVFAANSKHSAPINFRSHVRLFTNSFVVVFIIVTKSRLITDHRTTERKKEREGEKGRERGNNRKEKEKGNNIESRSKTLF